MAAMDWRTVVQSLKQSSVAIVLALVTLCLIGAAAFQALRLLIIHNS
jgi:hypothetical protein